jgi:D-mannonate dehydratase
MVEEKIMKKYLLSLSLVASAFAFEVEPVTDNEMKDGCVDCHFVYQAEFLPKKSWKKMFEKEELENHFGKKVELSDGLISKFLKYYLENASDISESKVARKINRSIEPESTPLQISKVPYIVSKHEDLPKEMFLENEKVKSYANCASCHEAKKGNYEEDDVNVPNWEKSFFFGWSRK